MTHFGNLLAPPTRLPVDPAVAELEAGTEPAQVAARYPASSAAWAALSAAALSAAAEGADPDAGTRSLVAGYAYARTGYHRGLDALRRAGWKGQGPVPWSHQPNRGFLRALHALATSAQRLGETDEAARCRTLLTDSDPDAVAALEA